MSFAHWRDASIGAQVAVQRSCQVEVDDAGFGSDLAHGDQAIESAEIDAAVADAGEDAVSCDAMRCRTGGIGCRDRVRTAKSTIESNALTIYKTLN